MYKLEEKCADDSSSSQVKNSSIIQVEDTRFASMMLQTVNWDLMTMSVGNAKH